MSRVKVWIRSRTKKDGTPVNNVVSETIVRLSFKLFYKICLNLCFEFCEFTTLLLLYMLNIQEKLNKFESESPSSSTTDVREDSLSKVLGQDKYGRLRGLGRGMAISKLAFFQTKDKYTSQMETRIKELEIVVNTLVRDKVIYYLLYENFKCLLR